MEDVQKSLREARERLAAFEDSSARENLMGRLRASSPAHPVLMGRNLIGLGTLVLLLGAAAALVAPMLGRDIAVTLNGMSEGLGFPFPIAMLMLAICGSAMVAGLHQLALAAARNAPLLPNEAKQHQRLVADVKQLESRLALEGTPRPAVRVTSH